MFTAGLTTAVSSQASADSPAFAQGTLTGANGQPAAGVVTLLAWPDPLPTKVGCTFTMIPVAAQRTSADGSYRFTADDIHPTPALAKAAAFNNGVVNFQAVGTTPDSTGENNFSQSVTATKATAVNIAAKAPVTKGMYQAATSMPQHWHWRSAPLGADVGVGGNGFGVSRAALEKYVD